MMGASTAAQDRSRIVTGLFRDVPGAERAYRSAVALGYDASDINLAMSDETRKQFVPGGRLANTEVGRDTAESAEGPSMSSELGGPPGATAGTLAPVIAAVGTLMLAPGLVLAGPVATALTAAGAVALAGGLAGALVEWGVPEERITQYEAGIREGGIVIGVSARSLEHARELEQQWRASGGELVHR